MLGDASDFYVLSHKLNAASTRVVVPIAAAMGRTVRTAASDARAMAPQGPTGQLKAGISGRSIGLAGEVVSEAPYSDYVEDGTSDTPPQPFMRPALERNLPVFEAAFTEAPEALL